MRVDWLKRETQSIQLTCNALGHTAVRYELCKITNERLQKFIYCTDYTRWSEFTLTHDGILMACITRQANIFPVAQWATEYSQLVKTCVCASLMNKIGSWLGPVNVLTWQINTSHRTLLLFSWRQHLTNVIIENLKNLLVKKALHCCLFWPVFRCLQHLKASQNTFFNRFQPFFFF